MKRDFVFERMLQIPEATITVLYSLIDMGYEFDDKPENYSYQERIELIEYILYEAELREKNDKTKGE